MECRVWSAHCIVFSNILVSWIPVKARFHPAGEASLECSAVQYIALQL